MSAFTEPTTTINNLTTADLDAFRRLGIGPGLLERAGVERVGDRTAREKFGIKAHGDCTGIIFPYVDPLTGVRHTARLRRDNPEIEAGKPKRKYLSAYGDRHHLYFVPGCGQLVHDGDVPIILVEAEKSALALTAWAARTGRRLLPVALGGCWGWRGTIGRVEDANGRRVDEVGPLPELLAIGSAGRKVYVLFDANCSTNMKVQQARAELVRVPQRNKANVIVLSLPMLDAVNGPDDYIGIAGDEALAKLIDSAAAGAVLLDRLEGFYLRFISMTRAQAAIFTLWTVLTYAIAAAETTPYIAVTSAEKRSGKTMLLEAAELLVNKPWLTGRVTAACLVRKIDAQHPTLLLDESDAAFSGDKEYAEALRGVLNSGYRRGGTSSCCVGQGANITFKDFSTFCPKAIAGIGKLPDTVADRSIPVRLKRKAPGEAVERFRRRDVEPEARQLREAIAAWASEKLETLRAARPLLPDQLSDRQQDVSEPLIAIADTAGGDWPTKARAALIELLTGAASEDESIGVQLLGDIKAVFTDRGVERISSEELVQALAEMEDRPWPEFSLGKPITKAALGRLLRSRYEIRPRNVRIRETQSKGYELAWFTDAFCRYLNSQVSQVSQGNNDAGQTQFCNLSQQGGGTDAKSENSPVNMQLGTYGTDEAHCKAPGCENPRNGGIHCDLHQPCLPGLRYFSEAPPAPNTTVVLPRKNRILEETI